jgi:hypothetical protein
MRRSFIDRLLSQIDKLNILKTRARYTLQNINRASVRLLVVVHTAILRKL